MATATSASAASTPAMAGNRCGSRSSSTARRRKPSSSWCGRRWADARSATPPCVGSPRTRQPNSFSSARSTPCSVSLADHCFALSRGEALFFEVPMLDVPHAMTTEPGETSFDLRKEAEEAGITGTLQQLEQELIGLKPVKNRVRQIASLLLIERIRQRAGLASSPPTLHMSFTGNPGTGKTTVALRMAKILHGLGFVRRGQVISVTRDDLVGQYIGHTAPKTKEILKKAMGGVLFIDEAYYLYRPENERDYGQEAIEILLQVMENRRNDLVVILAGYADRMDRFFTSNPGFRSRIAHHIDFPDYDAAELMAI